MLILSTTLLALSLTQTVAKLDERLFAAYNNSDQKTLRSLVADDLEFYQDNAGVSLGKKVFMDDYQRYITGKVRRVLVAGTLEVSPIKGFGAVEAGVHRFYHPGHDQTEPVGEARFVMVWRHSNGKWILARVFSYGHGLAN